MFVAGYELSNLKDIIKLIVSMLVFFLVWVATQNILFRISERKANEETEE